MEPIVLEDWLRSSVSSTSSALAPASAQSAPPEFAANAIAQAWAHIRICVQQQRNLTSSDSEAFTLLNRHRRSLHLADPQAKLLQALLTEVSSSDAVLLGFVRRFAVLGLLSWIRKSFTGPGSNSSATSTKRPAPEALASVVQSTRKAMEERCLSDLYSCEVILLLGTISTMLFVSAAVRSDCLTFIVGELEERRDVIARGALAEALAGAGLALAVSSEEHLIPILRALLWLWTPTLESPPGTDVAEDKRRLVAELDNRRSGREQDGTILKDVVILLHLMDYLCSNFFSRENSQSARSTSPLEVMHEALLRVLSDSSDAQFSIQCTSIMVSAGLLRSLYRWDQGNKKRGIATPVDHKWLAIMRNLEEFVVTTCEQVVTPNAGMSSTFPSGPLLAAPGICLRTGNRQLCRCVSVAVSRCRGLPAHPHILRCLFLCVFGDALDLHTLYAVLTPQLKTGGVGINQQQEGASQAEKMLPTEKSSERCSSLGNLEVHVGSFFFQEMGAIAGAMCDQYHRASGDQRGQTEHMVSEYARNLYEKHRLLVATSQKPQKEEWRQYKQTLEKVLEAAFIIVVVFFSLVVREHLPDNDGSFKAERAALAVDSLSCFEYFPRVQMNEFSKVIQRSVYQIAGSEAASILIAGLLPAYQDIIRRPGTPGLNLTYSWSQDEVQTARILFYFRVMPLCLIKMPEETFAAEVAPVMFLYMQHPSESVAKASHAVFASFLSLGVRSELTLKLGAQKSQKSTAFEPETKSAITPTLREQLAVFYIQRTLQEFPGVTPFQGLVAGVGAIARQLPAGSPATVYCLNCLVDKAVTLYSTKFNSKSAETPEGKQPRKERLEWNGENHSNFPDEEIGAARKVQILLLHLALLVDLQVLPVLLKLLAKLILSLPGHVRTAALAEAFDVIGGSDDYTRKPVVVPWLQSLSFISFYIQNNPNNIQPRNDEDSEKNSSGTVSNPETLSKSKSIEVMSSECVARQTTEDEKQDSNGEGIVEIKAVMANWDERHLRESPKESLESDNQACTSGQAGQDDAGLEPRSKL